MNLGRQTRSLLERLGTNSQFASHIQSAATTRELLDALSKLLLAPAFTLLVAREFRPVLFDLCARWLLVDGHMDEILIALCLLLEAHPELFPCVGCIHSKACCYSFAQDFTCFLDQDLRPPRTLALPGRNGVPY